MSERLHEFRYPVVDRRGRTYHAHIEAEERPDGRWEGRVVFTPVERGEPLSTGAETEQMDHADVQYWASGLTQVYLEGALERAQDDRRLESHGEWREPTSPGSIARFSVRSRDDRAVADLLGTFTLTPGMSRHLPDGSRLTYTGTSYEGEDGSLRAHAFVLEEGGGGRDWVSARVRECGAEVEFD